MTQQARPIIKNKFWIVEEDGRQVGTIQAAPDGVVYVHDHIREKFATFKLLSNKYNIRAVKPDRTTKNPAESVHDYPCEGPIFNPVYDLKSRLPLYTKEEKSKSYYCAGYYLVEIESEQWIPIFCPKKIILTRHQYLGPFRTIRECKSKK